MIEHRTQLQAQAAVGGQESIARDFRVYLAIAQDEMRQHGEHRLTCRALNASDSDPTQTDADIRGVVRQAPASITDSLVLQLETEGQEEGEDTHEKRLPIAQELKVRRFISKI